MENNSNETETLTYQDGTQVKVRREYSTSTGPADQNLEIAMHRTTRYRLDCGEPLKYVNENEFLDATGKILRKVWSK